MKRLLFSNIVLCCILASCIQNDIPLPYNEVKITSISAKGCLKTEIFENTQTVLLTMDEVEDLSKVTITDMQINYPDAVASVDIVGRTIDLRTPYEITFTKYERSFTWKITATQTIERLVSFRGQVGATEIDETNCRVHVKISKSIPLTWLEIDTLKLGPRDITRYYPKAGKLHNFTKPVQVSVSYRDVDEDWTIYAESSTMSVEFTAVSPRTRCCWLKANAPDGADNGFRYRAVGDTLWKNVPDINAEAGTISACIDSLAPLKEYECVAFSGDEETPVEKFTTEEEWAVPNFSFESFSKSSSGSYMVFFDPNAEDPSCRTPWWGSGNGSETVSGSADMGYVICEPDDKEFVDGKYSAKLSSLWAVVKFAAGNLFAGEFAGLIGTSGGKVNFGQPYTLRPASLHLWYKYSCGKVDHVNDYPAGDPVKVGDNDRGQIYIALGDWDYKTYGGSQNSPVQVNTTDKTTFFNPEGPNVIAYGSFMTDQSSDGWQELDIPIIYRDNFRKPTHIIISCASSALGDYFTGSSESRMWIDKVELKY